MREDDAAQGALSTNQNVRKRKRAYELNILKNNEHFKSIKNLTAVNIVVPVIDFQNHYQPIKFDKSDGKVFKLKVQVRIKDEAMNIRENCLSIQTNSIYPEVDQDVIYTYNLNTVTPLKLLSSYGFGVENNLFSEVFIQMDYQYFDYHKRNQLIALCREYDKDESLIRLYGCHAPTANLDDFSFRFHL